MTRHFRTISLVLLFMVAAFSVIAMTPAIRIPSIATTIPKSSKVTVQGTLPLKSRAAFAVEVTATPTKTKTGIGSLELQAGHSDWIVALAIFIVLIIVIPILLKYKEWRGS